MVDDGSQAGLVQKPLTIHSASGVHRFTVEVAATPEQQERGLMFRRSLAPDRGMIFPYNPPQLVGFWMRNTLIPLDMVFIRADGRIARVATAKPLDETVVPGASRSSPYWRSPADARLSSASLPATELTGGADLTLRH